MKHYACIGQTHLVLGQAVPFSNLAVVFPVGLLATTIPIAPGGLGVGHAVFDHLFSLINITGGADVFNLFILGQMFCNLLAAIPYLLARESINLSEKEA